MHPVLNPLEHTNRIFKFRSLVKQFCTDAFPVSKYRRNELIWGMIITIMILMECPFLSLCNYMPNAGIHSPIQQQMGVRN